MGGNAGGIDHAGRPPAQRSTQTLPLAPPHVKLDGLVCQDSCCGAREKHCGLLEIQLGAEFEQASERLITLLPSLAVADSGLPAVEADAERSGAFRTIRTEKPAHCNGLAALCPRASETSVKGQDR